MKAFFVDTTRCTACRGCQVACKQWHNLPAETTLNLGTYQNPPDLSFSTYKLVRMNEQLIGGKLKWLFFPDQCRHCLEPPCLETARDPSAIFKDSETGAVIYTANTGSLDFDEIRSSCPYDIPRKAGDGTIAKCDMCLDRIQNGLQPACVKTCPSGAMHFGERDEILAQAKRRLDQVKPQYGKAALIDPEDISVIYLVAHDPSLYHESAVAMNTRKITRQMALQKIFSPARRLSIRL